MSIIKQKQIQMVQLYDKVKENVYTKIVSGLFWSHEEIVRKETVGSERILDIRFTGNVDKILINGKSINLKTNPLLKEK
jgi:hypothetical protein